MASDPGQPFWLHYLRRVQHVVQSAADRLDKNGLGPEYVTGPAGLREALLEWWEQCAGQGQPHNVTVMDRKVCVAVGFWGGAGGQHHPKTQERRAPRRTTQQETPVWCAVGFLAALGVVGGGSRGEPHSVSSHKAGSCLGRLLG